MSVFRRDDLSIFIPHVIETIFVEIKVNETKSVIVGVTYRPNSFPHADIDLFIQKITEVANIISLENKESYLMGDFNIDLLKFQTLFRPQSNVRIEFNNRLSINVTPITQIGESDEPQAIKFLGIYIDKHLTWNQQIKQMFTNLSKSIFALNKVKKFLPYAAMKSLYFALIQSRIQYGTEVWGNGNNINKLFIVQKRAIRVIHNKRYRHHTDPLFKESKILKV